MFKKTLLGGVAAFLISLGLGSAHADDRIQPGQLAKLTSIPSQCAAAAQANGTAHIVFRKSGNIGKFWCASTDREGTLLAVRSSDHFHP